MIAARCISATDAARSHEITGEAFHRERLLLPPDATFEAVLEDVSLADAPAKVLGRTTLSPAGQSPFVFSITYEPGEIVERHRYGVRATIRVDGALWFTSDTFHSVLSEDAPEELRIPMRMVR